MNNNKPNSIWGYLFFGWLYYNSGVVRFILGVLMIAFWGLIIYFICDLTFGEKTPQELRGMYYNAQYSLEDSSEGSLIEITPRKVKLYTWDGSTFGTKMKWKLNYQTKTISFYYNNYDIMIYEDKDYERKVIDGFEQNAIIVNIDGRQLQFLRVSSIKNIGKRTEDSLVKNIFTEIRNGNLNNYDVIPAHSSN